MPRSQRAPRPAERSDAVANTSDAIREQRYWMGQLHAALAGYIAVVATVLTYVAITWLQPNRGWILIAALSAIVVAGSCYGLRRWIVTTPHRLWLFALWNFASFVFVALFALLDGGIGSPMAYLLILPTLYLAIAYPLRATVICGAAGLLCTGVLLWLSPGPVDYPALVFKLMVLNIGFMLAIIGATIRDRNEHELRLLQQRLENLAATDDLTGCANQRAFNAAVKNEIARAERAQQPLALLLIDVDHFKAVNDRHGHIIGDEVLRQIGSSLLQSARQTDTAGRPGGDEFALLAPNTGRDEAHTLARRLQKRIGEQPLPAHITLSIGICAMTPDAEQAATLRRYADIALYRAKRQGRNQIACFDDDVQATEDPAPRIKVS